MLVLVEMGQSVKLLNNYYHQEFLINFKPLKHEDQVLTTSLLCGKPQCLKLLEHRTMMEGVVRLRTPSSGRLHPIRSSES